MRTYLQAQYDSRKDFGNKAVVETKGETISLYSYLTLVAEIKKGKPIVYGWFSTTTARHINEFLRQNGFNTMTKSEMEKGSK